MSGKTVVLQHLTHGCSIKISKYFKAIIYVLALVLTVYIKD